MVVACEQVWREVSNYLDGDIAPELRSAVDEHARTCSRCTAVLIGTSNVIALYGDERMVEVPLGFSSRLHRKLEENMPRQRGKIWRGWVIGFATVAALILVMAEVGNTPPSRQPLRAELAQPGHGVPPDLMVVVASDGKTFHVPGCKFLHDKTNLRTITAAEAKREGYVPCVRCMKQYLTEAEARSLKKAEGDEELAESE